MVTRIICLAVGYLFGLFQTGYIVGKTRSIDIRQHGSGNAGTTNALRVMGMKAGVLVFLGDFLKAVAACLLMGALLGKGDPALTVLVKLYTGLGVVLGHDFPATLSFRGGKGIASTAGVCAALGDMRIFLSLLVVFVVVIAVTRYVSLGSLLILAGFVLEWILLGHAKTFGIECTVLILVFAALGAWRHRANIGRLLSGTENKLGQKKKE